MRSAVLAAIAVGTAAMTASARAQTYDPNYPVCMQIFGPVGYFDCSYTAIEQCRFLAVGRSALCTVNPYYAPSKPASGRRTVRRTH
jgi:hypothetical protein